MERARELIKQGTKTGSRWRLGAGVALGVFAILKRATKPEAETVDRVVVSPGEKIVIETHETVRVRRRIRKKRRA